MKKAASSSRPLRWARRLSPHQRRPGTRVRPGNWLRYRGGCACGWRLRGVRPWLWIRIRPRLLRTALRLRSALRLWPGLWAPLLPAQLLSILLRPGSPEKSGLFFGYGGEVDAVNDELPRRYVFGSSQTHPCRGIRRKTIDQETSCGRRRKLSIARLESKSARPSPFRICVLILRRRNSAVCCGSSISPIASRKSQAIWSEFSTSAGNKLYLSWDFERRGGFDVPKFAGPQSQKRKQRSAPAQQRNRGSDAATRLSEPSSKSHASACCEGIRCVSP